jgi:hypothetical protein
MSTNDPFDQQGGSPPPVSPQTLDYGRPRTGQYVPRTPLWVQFVLGMVAPFIGVFGFGATVSAMRLYGNSVLIAGVMGLVSVFVLGVFARVRFGWRGFLPGVATGIGLSLLAVGLCFAIVCGF